MKIMKIIEIHQRITKTMKIKEIYMRITKIFKYHIMPQNNNENNENLRISYENHKHYENLEFHIRELTKS